MSKLLIITEHRNEQLNPNFFELLTAANIITANLNAEPVAVVLEKNSTVSSQVKQYVNDVISVNNEKIAMYTQDSYVAAIKSVVSQLDMAGILIAHSYDGVDFAARLALQLNMPIVTNCCGIEFENNTTVFTRNIYNGKIQEKRTIKGNAFVATFQKGIYPPSENTVNGKVTNQSVTIGEIRTSIKEVIETITGSIDITKAKIIIAGGRGLKDVNKYNELIIPLAQKLGGEHGASRPAVDAGWTELARQVGQSGKYVSPDLYFAIGISGATQHVAGMKGAKCVVAINKDPEAPIFNIADYGIVGDAYQVVPAIINNL